MTSQPTANRPDPAQATYTFEFEYTTPDGQQRWQTRTVPAKDLWQRFGEAADWRRAGTHEQARRVFFYGPGVFRRVVDETARDRLVEVLEPLGLLPLDRPQYVGLLWADLGKGYVLHKIRKATVELEGYERPHVAVHTLEAVPGDKTQAGMRWARETCWKPYGCWINEKPALLWAGRLTVAAQALEDMLEVAPLLHNRRYLRAPCAYDWRGENNKPYPYIKPTRSVPQIHRQRARWPNALDVKWTPSEVLRERHGDGIGLYHPMMVGI